MVFGVVASIMIAMALLKFLELCGDGKTDPTGCPEWIYSLSRLNNDEDAIY